MADAREVMDKTAIERAISEVVDRECGGPRREVMACQLRRVLIAILSDPAVRALLADAPPQPRGDEIPYMFTPCARDGCGEARIRHDGDGSGSCEIAGSACVGFVEPTAERAPSPAPQPPPAALGRFGHHPDPAIDFCCEVDAIEGAIADVRAGLEQSDPVRLRIERAMTFRVGGDEHALRAKDRLRQAERDLAPSPPLTSAPAPPAPFPDRCSFCGGGNSLVRGSYAAICLTCAAHCVAELTPASEPTTTGGKPSVRASEPDGDGAEVLAAIDEVNETWSRLRANHTMPAGRMTEAIEAAIWTRLQRARAAVERMQRDRDSLHAEAVYDGLLELSEKRGNEACRKGKPCVPPEKLDRPSSDAWERGWRIADAFAKAAELQQARADRADALNVRSRDGLLSSEWIARTGKAERERDAALADLDARTRERDKATCIAIDWQRTAESRDRDASEYLRDLDAARRERDAAVQRAEQRAEAAERELTGVRAALRVEREAHEQDAHTWADLRAQLERDRAHAALAPIPPVLVAAAHGVDVELLTDADADAIQGEPAK